MNPSSHAFCCWIGTLPVLILNFVFDNSAGALAVGILSGTILLIAGILYVLEKKKANERKI